MKIKIETYGLYEYKEILKEYGEVLMRYGISETKNGHAEINIETLDDIFNLHKEIEKFFDDINQSLPYFGLMIRSYDDGTPYLEIKDNYD